MLQSRPVLGEDPFFCDGNFRPLLREENEFLLATTPEPAGRGVVGNAATALDDVGMWVLFGVKALCRTNS